MDTQSIVTYKSAFDAIMHEITADDGSKMEVWYARELQTVCGYARWENFAVAISRAKEACKSQSISIDDHFRDVTKTIPMPKGAQKEIYDIHIYYKSIAQRNARDLAQQAQDSGATTLGNGSRTAREWLASGSMPLC